MAWRTRLSFKIGWRVLSTTYQTAEEFDSATTMFGSFRRSSRLSGGTSMVRSISPVLMADEPRLRLDDRHVDGLADLRRPAPVLVVAREHHLDARLPRLELEGPRAHRVLHDVLAVLLERVRAVDEERLVREVLEEGRERRLEPDLHGERVDHLDARHVAEEALHVRVRAGLVVRALLVQLPVEAELDRLGGERRAVVERHVRRAG